MSLAERKFLNGNFLKNAAMVVTVMSTVAGGLLYINNYAINKAVKDTKKSIVDSMQNIAIQETRESIGTSNRRIDNVNDKLNEQRLFNEQIIEKLDNNSKVLQIIVLKIDKSLLPLLKERQALKAMKNDTTIVLKTVSR